MNCLLSDKECVQILLKSLKHSQFRYLRSEIKKFSQETLGYLGEHLLLNVFYTISGASQVREMSYFIKCVPQTNREQKEFVESMGLIRKEVNLYEKLFGRLQELVSERFCAEFYYGRDDVIVFENLQARNFKMASEDYFGAPKIKSVLKTMAIMHAACLILEEKKHVALVAEYPNELTDNKFDFVENQPRNNWYKASAKCVARLCEYFTGKQHYANKILDYLKHAMPKLDDVSTTSRNVLCHDDLWVNNILFDENDACLFVDFQLAKYGPPAFDVWIFLYFNTENELLQTNLAEFIDFYYNTLEGELSRNSIDISNIMPKEAFLKSIEEYATPTLFQVCICQTYIFVSKEFNEKMMQNKALYEDFNFGDRGMYIFEEMKKNSYFEDRFKNTILLLCKMFDL